MASSSDAEIYLTWQGPGGGTLSACDPRDRRCADPRVAQRHDMRVTDGRFTGADTSAGPPGYEAAGQLDGSDRDGVAGHVSGADFKPV